MKWKEKIIELGEVTPGTNVNVTFEGVPDEKLATTVSAGCGCTKVKFNKSENNITVYFKVNDFPRHMPSSTSYNLKRRIYVHYSTGEKEELIIRGKVVRK